MKPLGLPLLLFVGIQTIGAETPVRPAFDAASIRPWDPAGRGYAGVQGGPGTKDVTRVRMGLPLSAIVRLAYGDLAPYRLAAPDWVDTSRFDIQATMPEGTTNAVYQQMLQNMLEERFHLKMHREIREMTIYDLVIGKGGHKLTESTGEPPIGAGPSGRPKLGNDGFPLPTPGRTMIIHMPRGARIQGAFMPMDELVRLLSNELKAPIADQTGLTGKYDFRLDYAAQLGPILISGANPTETSPDAPPVRVAVQDQLGLRLEPKKGRIEVIVVDSMDNAPTEN